MKFANWLILPLVLCASAALAAEDAKQPSDAEKVTRGCDALSADLAKAGEDGKLDEAAKLYEDAQKPAAKCEPKQVFCLGRRVALAHVDLAYGKLEKGETDEAGKILEKGQKFGEPWALMVALGDVASGRARSSHDPKIWSDASLAYQKGYAALPEAALCDGEPQKPTNAAIDQIVEKLNVASLLAKPLVFFHSKCAPCQLVFLQREGDASQKARVLPMTFVDGQAKLTSEGAQTMAAFGDCVMNQKWTSISLSAHTDERGTDRFNLDLSKRRLDEIKRLLTERGYHGGIDALPKGKSEPLPVEDRGQLTTKEAQLLERRVELRSVKGEQQTSCTATADQNAKP